MNSIVVWRMSSLSKLWRCTSAATGQPQLDIVSLMAEQCVVPGVMIFLVLSLLTIPIAPCGSRVGDRRHHLRPGRRSSSATAWYMYPTIPPSSRSTGVGCFGEDTKQIFRSNGNAEEGDKLEMVEPFNHCKLSSIMKITKGGENGQRSSSRKEI